MADYQGFWSYVRKDDDVELGRIVQLAHDVVAQFELLTGETIELFLDRDVIDWGDQWKQQIEQGLAAVAFFVPVITPRYFASVACRDELEVFLAKSEERGTKELVLPLLYVEVPSLKEDGPDDELVRHVKNTQWVDWTELRFADRSSSEYRSAVARLAKRIVDVNRTMEAMPDAAEAAIPFADEADALDAPGTIDIVADMEAALPEVHKTLEEFSTALKAITAAANELEPEVERATAGSMADKVRLARVFAAGIRAPSSQIKRLGTQFASQLHRVDDGVLEILQAVEQEDSLSDGDRTAVCGFFAAVEGLAAATSESLKSVKEMVEQLQPMEKVSRDLRPPVRMLRTGLTSLLQAEDIMENWVKRIEAIDVDCDGVEAAEAS